MKPHPSPGIRPGSLLNWKGTVLLIGLLAAGDLAVAYGLSPWITRQAVEAINRYTDARVLIEDLRLHPMLLTLTSRHIEVADPDDPTRRMFMADSLRAGLDPLALLSRQIFLGRLSFKQVELVLVKDAQGEFNIEKLLKKEEDGTQKKGGWTSGVKDWIQQKTNRKDWFAETYDKAKNWVKKPSDESKKNAKKEIEVHEEPKGRVVSFNAPQDTVFRIGLIRIDGGRLILSDADGRMPPLENLNFRLKSFVLRRSGDFEFASFDASGRLKTTRDGRFDLNLERSKHKILARIRTQNLDLAPLRSLYEESSPVAFEKGFLTLDCRTELTANAIDSHNTLKLEDYRMSSQTQAKVGPVPASLIVDALNRRKSFEMQFSLSGDPDHPSTSGFESTLWGLVKDDLGPQALQTLESKTGVKLGELSEKLKKLF